MDKQQSSADIGKHGEDAKAWKAWLEVRRRVLKRDNYRCRVFECDVKGSRNVSPHHVLPRDEGGGDHDENLLTLCHKHHDEIEMSGLHSVALIANWCSTDDAFSPTSRTILDVVGAPRHGKENASVVLLDSNENPTNQHSCHVDTVAAIWRLREGGTPWADIAKHLRYSPTFAVSLSAVAANRTGAISAQSEDELRVRLGLYPRNAVMVPRCTTCNLPHLPGTPCIWQLPTDIPEEEDWLASTDSALEEHRDDRQSFGGTVSPAVDAALVETQKAVLDHKKGLSWRALAAAVDVPYSVLYIIGKGRWNRVSWPTVCKVRVHLGLSDPGDVIGVLACPICGHIHMRTCARARRAPRKSVHLSPAVHARANARRKAAGMTWDQWEERP
jgi:hypothetical protein